MKHLKKVAAKLDDHGRNGDSIVAHLNPREAALLKALGGAGTINPKTGLLEFYDGGESGNDATGGGNAGGIGDPGGFDSSGQGGGQIADLSPQDQQALGFNPNDLADTRSATISAFNPMYDEAAQAAQYSPRSMPQRAFDWARNQPREFVQDLQDKPFSTLANVAMPGAFGLVNNLVGMASASPGVAGRSLTDRAIGGIASMTGFNGPQSAPNTQTASGSVTGQTTAAIGPSGDTDNEGPVSGTADNYNPTQSGASGSGVSPIAQALMGTTPSNQRNSGRMTYGALNSTYSPFGREYVSPWAYRG
jgi:hypothetical protein